MAPTTVFGVFAGTDYEGADIIRAYADRAAADKFAAQLREEKQRMPQCPKLDAPDEEKAIRLRGLAARTHTGTVHRHSWRSATALNSPRSTQSASGTNPARPERRG